MVKSVNHNNTAPQLFMSVNLRPRNFHCEKVYPLFCVIIFAIHRFALYVFIIVVVIVEELSNEQFLLDITSNKNHRKITIKKRKKKRKFSTRVWNIIQSLLSKYFTEMNFDWMKRGCYICFITIYNVIIWMLNESRKLFNETLKISLLMFTYVIITTESKRKREEKRREKRNFE